MHVANQLFGIVFTDSQTPLCKSSLLGNLFRHVVMKPWLISCDQPGQKKHQSLQWVPWDLTLEQKHMWVQKCQVIHSEDPEGFFARLVTERESWFHYHTPKNIPLWQQLTEQCPWINAYYLKDWLAASIRKLQKDGSGAFTWVRNLYLRRIPIISTWHLYIL
jgi:hypothetical protein